MEVIKTDISGVVILNPKVFGDERGYFFESWNKRDFEAVAGPVNFVQDCESKSRYGVVRGLHFQKGEHAQAKLVRVVSGCVLDVAVVSLTLRLISVRILPPSESTSALNSPGRITASVSSPAALPTALPF